jgi:hypothetical protein
MRELDAAHPYRPAVSHLTVCECLNDTSGSDDWLRQLTTDLSMSKPFAVGEVASTLIAFSPNVGGASDGKAVKTLF